VDSTSVKNKTLQIDFLDKISGLLKTAACMDDAGAERISSIIKRLDAVIDELEENVGTEEIAPPSKGVPVLTIV